MILLFAPRAHPPRLIAQQLYQLARQRIVSKYRSHGVSESDRRGISRSRVDTCERFSTAWFSVRASHVCYAREKSLPPASCLRLKACFEFRLQECVRKQIATVKIDAHQDESPSGRSDGSCRFRRTDRSDHRRIAKS